VAIRKTKMKGKCCLEAGAKLQFMVIYRGILMEFDQKMVPCPETKIMVLSGDVLT
jgi:hypothetical protein